MNKKALAMNTMGRIILVLIVVIIMIFIFKKPVGTMDEFETSQSLQIKSNACLLEAENAFESGVIFNDKDNDGYPDSCDVCFGSGDSDGDGYNKDDSDLDGMPDTCDKEPEDPTIFECKEYRMEKDGEWFKNICCTNSAGSAALGISTDIVCALITS